MHSFEREASGREVVATQLNYSVCYYGFAGVLEEWANL